MNTQDNSQPKLTNEDQWYYANLTCLLGGQKGLVERGIQSNIDRATISNWCARHTSSPQSKGVEEAAHRYANDPDSYTVGLEKAAFKAGEEWQAGKPAKTLQECKDEVARSRGYKHWNQLFTACGYQALQIRMDEVAELYASQTQVAQSRWIRVAERLPEEKPLESYKLLAYGIWNDECIAFYQDKHFFDTDANDEDGNPVDITNLVTHWMPLPSTPNH